MERLRVLITVKTYPIPSAKYDELVCTAGVTEVGDFIRLYPINFRDLPYEQQYRKYQWLEVMAQRHRGRDVRKESWRPDPETVRILGEPIATGNGDWSERGKCVLKKAARSMEDLWEQQKQDRTSMGIFRPRRVKDLVVSETDPEWPPKFIEALKQARLWETRKKTLRPPRKVPWRFQYRFECDDERCNGNHQMTIEDWEVGQLYWNCIDRGDAPDRAVEKVRQKFLDQICGDDKETYFYVGTVSDYPTWVVIGTFWPRLGKSGNPIGATGDLFQQ